MLFLKLRDDAAEYLALFPDGRVPVLSEDSWEEPIDRGNDGGLGSPPEAETVMLGGEICLLVDWSRCDREQRGWLLARGLHAVGWCVSELGVPISTDFGTGIEFNGELFAFDFDFDEEELCVCPHLL